MQPVKKSRPKRRFLLFTALIAILALALLLFACENTDSSQSSNQSQSENSENIGCDSLSQYTIVRGDNSGNPTLKQALNLRTSIRSQANIDLPLSTDFIPDSGKPEILVGMTNRKASIDVSLEITESTKFIVRSVGNKIVVLSNTQNGLEEGVSYLASQYSADISSINHTEYSDEIILMNKNRTLQFVLPNDAPSQFSECAQTIIDSFGIGNISLASENKFNSEHAIFIGTVSKDPVSLSYADIINENEYTARLAANNVYLQGENDYLVLMALGDFLTLLSKHLDYDFEGNLCISLPDNINFSKTWEHALPKPINAELDSYENVSSNTQIFHYSSVSKEFFSLYKHQLLALGFSTDPLVSNYYQTGSTTAILDYLPEKQSLNVTISTGLNYPNLSHTQ